MSFLLARTLCRTSWASCSNASSLGSIARYRAKAGNSVLSEQRRRKCFIMPASFPLTTKRAIVYTITKYSTFLLRLLLFCRGGSVTDDISAKGGDDSEPAREIDDALRRTPFSLVPKTNQLVEKIGVESGLVSKQYRYTSKTPQNQVLGLQTELRKGHEGVF
jgi:hypothetical protein